MIRSMTGYGEASRQLSGRELRATIKTVNHRFFNAHLKTPQGFDRHEAEIQSWLKAFFLRGHVNLTLVMEKGAERSSDELPELDLDRARHYGSLLRTLTRELEVSGEPDLHAILRFGDLFRLPETAAGEAEIDPGLLREVVEEAAAGALAMRHREGERLKEDLLERVDALEEQLGLVQERAPARLLAERDRLRAAIRELSDLDDVDEERLARELAYTAERWDINEELVRFKAHLLAFRETAHSQGDEPVGKRLGFLVQEMHREANTIASKANDLEIGHASVAIREEIERLREQLENVE